MSKQNKLKNKAIPIKGMHCRSCEILIEEELLQIPGVKNVNVSEKKGNAEIFYTGDISDATIENTVNSCGYSIGSGSRAWFSKDLNDYYDLMKAILGVIILYFLAINLGFFDLAFNNTNNLASIPVVFLIGLTAGVSTCMALVGGLVLGVSARFAETHPHASPVKKFTPHLIFNSGRIIIFTILGGLMGYFGSLLQLGPASIGLLTVIVGMVMLILGLQTIGIFPKLEKIKFTLPKSLYKTLGIDSKKNQAYSNSGPFLLGGLSFFVPCGFTQAMQLYAISSGSFITGAITMGVFALGTTPGLLGIGGLAAIIKGKFANTFFKFVGLTVIALAIFNITNGFNLTGLQLPNLFASNTNVNAKEIINDPNVVIENGVQIVKMSQTFNGYSPKSFTIKANIPVKWIIDSKDSNSCASSIFSSQLGIRQYLKPGENIINFTPTTVGTIKFSCSMGMYTGYFNVVDGEIGLKDNFKDSGPTEEIATNPGTCGIADIENETAGCTMTGNQELTNTFGTTTDTNSVEGTQLLKATYTIREDMQPNNFSVKANKPVRLEVDAKEDGYGCMGSLALPGLSRDYQIFKKGQKTIMQFTPTKTGTYQITCAMGVPRGTIQVV